MEKKKAAPRYVRISEEVMDDPMQAWNDSYNYVPPVGYCRECLGRIADEYGRTAEQIGIYGAVVSDCRYMGKVLEKNKEAMKKAAGTWEILARARGFLPETLDSRHALFELLGNETFWEAPPISYQYGCGVRLADDDSVACIVPPLPFGMVLTDRKYEKAVKQNLDAYGTALVSQAMQCLYRTMEPEEADHLARECAFDHDTVTEYLQRIYPSDMATVLGFPQRFTPYYLDTFDKPNANWPLWPWISIQRPEYRRKMFRNAPDGGKDPCAYSETYQEYMQAERFDYEKWIEFCGGRFVDWSGQKVPEMPEEGP